MSHFQLDVRRLLCPLPVIRTQDKVKDLQVDDTLEIIGTDPGILSDIPSWCRINGHHILEMKDQGTEIKILIRVC